MDFNIFLIAEIRCSSHCIKTEISDFKLFDELKLGYKFYTSYSLKPWWNEREYMDIPMIVLIMSKELFRFHFICNGSAYSYRTSTSFHLSLYSWKNLTFPFLLDFAEKNVLKILLTKYANFYLLRKFPRLSSNSWSSSAKAPNKNLPKHIHL